jgi:hypothetical protein
VTLLWKKNKTKKDWQSDWQSIHWVGALEREGRISNPLRPVIRKSRLPRILVQFTNPSMLLESTVWKRLPEPVPSQAVNTKESQWGWLE